LNEYAFNQHIIQNQNQFIPEYSKMNTKLSYTLILSLLLFSSSIQAQLKELNFKEVFVSPPKDLLNPMPATVAGQMIRIILNIV
jgi:hypothetical protein